MNTQSEAFSDTSTAIEVCKIKAGPPLSWIIDAYRLIRAHWKTIVPAYLIVTIGTVLIQFGMVAAQPRNPGFGTLVLIMVCMFVAMLLQSGMMALFHGTAEQQPRINDVFRGFRGRSILGIFLLIIAMLLVTAVYGLLVYLAFELFGSSDAMMGILNPHGSYDRMMGSMMGGTSIVFALVLLGMAVVTALFCYAIPLIIVSGAGVISALANSFRASFKNLFVLCIFAMNIGAVYFLVLLIPMIGGALSTSMVIFLIVMALAVWLFALVINGAYYLSFRDVLLAGRADEGVAVE
ncbi:hypothetical protein [Marinobacter sp. JSM 1782161]|uniref:hypothetical protein n=1 Tax=Marinobacter sp. JSM 1782161 TaxID=2685906 RepID=UPI0014036124|nr:hypothetical protein [Marinobacter sp. JSM 1782161]